jgi:hypothetical protein
LGDGEVPFLGIVEGAPWVVNVGARGCREHLRDHRPNLGSMLEFDDMGNDLRCKGVDDEPKHSLIPTYPCKVGRIGDDRLLLVRVFNLDGLLRGRFYAIKETKGKKSLWITGRTRVCQKRKFDLISFWDGPDPSVAVRDVVDEDNTMVAVLESWRRRLQDSVMAAAANDLVVVVVFLWRRRQECGDDY